MSFQASGQLCDTDVTEMGTYVAVAWRGAIYYQTDAPELSRLNGIAVVYE